MRAALACGLLSIKNTLAERIFQCGTGLLLDRSINTQAVGYVWYGCTGTPCQDDFCLKRFKAIGSSWRLDAKLRMQPV
jgi:hypothetical protein